MRVNSVILKVVSAAVALIVVIRSSNHLRKDLFGHLSVHSHPLIKGTHTNSRVHTYNFDGSLLEIAAKSYPQDLDRSQTKYEVCPNRLRNYVINWTSDLDHVLQVMRRAPVLSEPFNYTSFMCDIWPPELYTNMIKYYSLLQKSMKKNNFTHFLGKAPCHFYGHCGVGVSNEEGCHNEFDLSNILLLKEERHDWKHFGEMLSTWTRVFNVLKSDELADLLWQKLNVLEKREGRQIRVISKLPTTDIDAIHSDSPYTIATFVFMFPNKLDEVFEYGTCLYSPKPEFANSLIYPFECSHKVRFFPNSAFMFRTVPGKLGGKYYYNAKRKVIALGRETRKLYRDKEISFPSWHSTPSMKYNSDCVVSWRKTLFLTFNCTGTCWKKWKEGRENL